MIAMLKQLWDSRRFWFMVIFVELIILSIIAPKAIAAIRIAMGAG
ncbi:hypothetical protein LCGC14_1268390 [marine sediment metagenome]|uniref:Uncharacterized protein n=1 Tax=marine sediment metagenome TaxID=412755 RepID=A0A0F9P1X9_9ZZZZ